LHFYFYAQKKRVSRAAAKKKATKPVNDDFACFSPLLICAFLLLQSACIFNFIDYKTLIILEVKAFMQIDDVQATNKKRHF
jgi:hypothetical protein